MAKFSKGSSGNPGGRPKAEGHVRELARQLTEKAIATLATCLDDDNGRIRVAAATALLDRAWGKAPQQVDLKSDFGGVDIAERIREARDRLRAIRAADGGINACP